MASAPLFVRNLTSSPVEVIRYEIQRHEQTQSEKRSRWNITRLLWFQSNGEEIRPFTCGLIEEISTHVGVLETGRLNVGSVNSPNETLKVFFKTGEEICHVDISLSKSYSRHLFKSKDNPNPKSDHFGIYHPLDRYLVLTYQVDYSSWMNSVRDDVLLSAISIPGTHNSPAFHRALPSVRCQAVTISEQLNNGIRFFDIRLQQKHPADPTRDDLSLVHGAFPVSFSPGAPDFRSLLNEVLDFLSHNSTETIIVSLKREGTGNGTDAQLCDVLRNHYVNDHRHWFTAPRVPFLGEVRGKIVLVRRFHLDDESAHEWGGLGWGIDAAVWADNTPNSLCPSGQVCIQDFYQVMEPKTIEQKIQYSIEHLSRAAERMYDVQNPLSGEGGSKKGEMPFFINFLTASNLWRTGCWPEKIAARLNPAILDHLCLKHNQMEDGDRKGDGSTGIVVCDWVGYKGNWDLIRCIIGMNSKYERSLQNPPASPL